MPDFKNVSIEYQRTANEGSGSSAHTEYIFLVHYPIEGSDQKVDWEVNLGLLDCPADAL